MSPWLVAIKCFFACLGPLFPVPLCGLGVPCRGHPQFPSTKSKATAPWQTDRGSNPRSVACVRGVFPVCYIAVTCVTIFRTTRWQNHFATLGLEPLTHWLPKTGPAPSLPREAGLASNPEGTVTRVSGAFQVCSLPLHSVARGGGGGLRATKNVGSKSRQLSIKNL